MLKAFKAYKITVYVPDDKFDAYIYAIQDEIPTFEGDYDRVAWWSHKGMEQFRPLEGARPARGEVGKTIWEASMCLELYIPFDKKILNAFIAQVLIPAHPWESPVISVQKTKLY